VKSVVEEGCNTSTILIVVVYILSYCIASNIFRIYHHAPPVVSPCIGLRSIRKHGEFSKKKREHIDVVFSLYCQAAAKSTELYWGKLTEQ
jgi:hypothetical protein